MSQLKSCSEMRSVIHCKGTQMTVDKASPRAPWVSYSSWKATVVCEGETVCNNSIWWVKVLHGYIKQEAGSKRDLELGQESWDSCSRFGARPIAKRFTLLVWCQPCLWACPSHLQGMKQSKHFAYVPPDCWMSGCLLLYSQAIYL